MATQKVFSIRDIKAEIFYPPFYKPTHGEAERAFRQTANDEKSMLKLYPEDFSLWYLGTYDDQTGEFTTTRPSHVMNVPPTQTASV